MFLRCIIWFAPFVHALVCIIYKEDAFNAVSHDYIKSLYYPTREEFITLAL